MHEMGDAERFFSFYYLIGMIEENKIKNLKT
jgi:hypothetical protein